MAKKSVFITGSSGFIGRNLAESLSGKYELFTPARSELDLMDYAAVEAYMKERKPDFVIHCANIGGSRKERVDNLVEKNLRMFMAVARSSKHFGRMIQLGSGAEYDKSRPLVKAKETDFDARIPQDDYGFYKYSCSKYIEEAENITCLRIFGCYGNYEDDETRFISNSICKAVHGLPITIVNRNVVFSYLHVEDFCRIAEHFLAHEGKHKFYNAVPDETIDLLSIANMVQKISGKKLQIKVRNPGLNPEYSGDNARLRAEIPSFRFTSMEDGVGRLYKWYDENKSLIDMKKLMTDAY